MSNKCQQCYYDCGSECAHRICIDEVDGLRNEISQLKQALQKLTPLQLVWDDSDLEGGYVETCIFCPDWLEYGHHSEDCEYIKLCGGDK